uniref:Major facilitator superfamily (MFS) profile domain-containing protein n=1 Tax=Bracon brevicornis TaxID=1563983 RepID=A0A6V7J0X0_9HYME
MTYTVTIFALTKTTVDPHIASISYGCSQVLGVCFSSLTVERLGRRKILFSSSTGMGLSHLTIGIFLLFQNAGYDISNFNWLPMVTISIFGFFYSSGMGPVTYILPNELYNPELASICSAVAMFILYTIAGTTIKLFPLLVEILGLHTCFFIFMLSCLYTFLFTFILPETKGKSMETIRKELSGELPKRPIKDPMQVVTKL